MKKRIKKKIKKLKKSINKINKVRVQKGRKAMLQETWATVTYGLYDNRKIRRLKKFPPALVENRMLFETNDDFTDNGRALFDYLIEKGYNKKYEIVWLVHEPSKYKEYQFENVKFVQNFKKGSTIRRAEAYKYALTSKYIFYTQDKKTGYNSHSKGKISKCLRPVLCLFHIILTNSHSDQDRSSICNPHYNDRRQLLYNTSY